MSNSFLSEQNQQFYVILRKLSPPTSDDLWGLIWYHPIHGFVVALQLWFYAKSQNLASKYSKSMKNNKISGFLKILLIFFLSFNVLSLDGIFDIAKRYLRWKFWPDQLNSYLSEWLLR
jgi:hypothetical protein